MREPTLHERFLIAEADPTLGALLERVDGGKHCATDTVRRLLHDLDAALTQTQAEWGKCMEDRLLEEQAHAETKRVAEESSRIAITVQERASKMSQEVSSLREALELAFTTIHQHGGLSDLVGDPSKQVTVGIILRKALGEKGATHNTITLPDPSLITTAADGSRHLNGCAIWDAPPSECDCTADLGEAKQVGE